MVIKEKEILGIINQVQQSVQIGEVPVELVPMDDLMRLIEATLGGNFWKGIGVTSQGAFDTMPHRYKILFEHCKETADSEGFVMALELLKNQYQCTYAMLSKEEINRRTKKYKTIVLNMGSALASVQYWLHQQRKKNVVVQATSLGKEARGVVYTCLVGNNATLYQPEYINVHLDYICFTDREEKWGTSDGIWEYRKMEKGEEQESESSMYYRYKIMPQEILREYDYSIWVNPQVQIVGELEQIYKGYGEGATFLAFPAYVENDLYGAVRTALNTDDENIELRRKLLRYREEGFPEHFGLISTNMMYRDHRDEKLKQVMQMWWRESKECQQLREFGFSYAAWKCNLTYSICDFFAESNPYINNVGLELDISE